MYYNTSRTLNKSVNEESEIFDAIVTHESSDTTTTFAKKTNFTSTIVYTAGAGEANPLLYFLRSSSRREFYTLQTQLLPNIVGRLIFKLDL